VWLAVLCLLLCLCFLSNPRNTLFFVLSTATPKPRATFLIYLPRSVPGLPLPPSRRKMLPLGSHMALNGAVERFISLVCDFPLFLSLWCSLALCLYPLHFAFCRVYCPSIVLHSHAFPVSHLLPHETGMLHGLVVLERLMPQAFEAIGTFKSAIRKNKAN